LSARPSWRFGYHRESKLDKMETSLKPWA